MADIFADMWPVNSKTAPFDVTLKQGEDENIVAGDIAAGRRHPGLFDDMFQKASSQPIQKKVGLFDDMFPQKEEEPQQPGQLVNPFPVAWDAAKTIGSGFTSWIPAGYSFLTPFEMNPQQLPKLRGIGKTIAALVPGSGVPLGDWMKGLQEASKTALEIQDALVIEPKTERGAMAAEAVAKPIAWLKEIGDENGLYYDRLEEEATAPGDKAIYRALAAASRFGGEAAPFLLPVAFKYGKAKVTSTIKEIPRKFKENLSMDKSVPPEMLSGEELLSERRNTKGIFDDLFQKESLKSDASLNIQETAKDQGTEVKTKTIGDREVIEKSPEPGKVSKPAEGVKEKLPYEMTPMEYVKAGASDIAGGHTNETALLMEHKKLVEYAASKGVEIPADILKIYRQEPWAVELIKKRKSKSAADEMVEAAEDTPLYKAIEEIKRQGGIRYADMVNLFGEKADWKGNKRLTTLSKDMPGLISKKGGALIDRIADEYGFASADELVTAIIERKSKREIASKVKDDFNSLYGEEIALAKKNMVKTPNGVPAADLSVGDILMKDGKPMRVAVIHEGIVHIMDHNKVLHSVDLFDTVPVDSARVKKGISKSAGPTIDKIPEAELSTPSGKYGATEALMDLNDILGERGAIGGKEFTPEQLAKRERLSRFLDNAIAEAMQKGLRLADQLKVMGITDTDLNRMMAFQSERNRQARGVERTDFPQEADGATSIKNAETLTDRQNRNLQEVRDILRRGDEAIHDEGVRRVASGEVDPRMMARSIVENPRAISGEDAYGLLYDRITLKKEHMAARDEITSARAQGDVIKGAEAQTRLLAIEEAMAINEAATVYAGTISAQGLRARRALMLMDYSLVEMVSREMRDNGGKPLTPEYRAALENFSKRIEELQTRLGDRDLKIKQLESVAAVERMKREVAKEERFKKRTDRQYALRSEYGGYLNELNVALKSAARGESLSVGLPPEAVKALGKMAKNKVESGIITVEGIIDSIYSDIKEMGIELSKRDIRDAISGYGKTSKMSQEELKVQLREVKRQMRLISGLEDAQSGQAPLRSGLQRDIPSDTVRELDRQVKQAMRDSGIDFTTTRTPEQQWKTSLDAIKTGLKNQIRDLEKQIATGEKTPKKTGVKYDAEALGLKERRDSLKAIVQEMEGKPEISVEVRIKNALSAVERSIKEYERRIGESDLEPQKRVSKTPETPELKAARETRDALKETYKEMQREARPNKTPEEVAQQAWKTRNRNKLAELERRLEEGDFETTKRKPVELDKESMEIKYNLEKTIRTYNEARFKEALKRRSKGEKMFSYIGEVQSLVRALWTSFDLSWLRQGAPIGIGHPILAVKSLYTGAKAFNAKQGFISMQEINNRPNATRYKRDGLDLTTEKSGANMIEMEEMYQSRWAEKIPGIAQSQRGFTVGLNRLRVDAYDAFADIIENPGIFRGMLGLKPREMTLAEGKAIANLVNVATGRSSVGKRSQAIVGLNQFLFAPRLVMSRFQLLAGQPLYRGTMATRMIVAEQYAKFLIGGALLIQLALVAGADEIETDPTSSDYLKIKFGNTRIDPFGGLQQPLVFINRLIYGHTKTQQGKLVPIRDDYNTGLGDKPYGKPNAFDLTARYVRSKLAPVPGMVADTVTGQNIMGQKVNAYDLPGKLITPMTFNDIFGSLKEKGLAGGVALGLLSTIGMGVGSYEPGVAESTFFQDLRKEFIPDDDGRRRRAGRNRR